MKTLNNVDVGGARQAVLDLEVTGNGDAWQLICKASSRKEGWMKSTKAMQIGHGVLVQVTTQQRTWYGGWTVAEAVAFVPNARIEPDANGGRKIVHQP